MESNVASPPTPSWKIRALLGATVAFATLGSPGWTASPSSDAPGFKEDFETGSQVPAGWTAQGAVAIDTNGGFAGRNSLVLSPAPESPDQPCSATSPSFKITPGVWKIDLACKSDLKSPDNSYDGVVTLEYLSGSNAVLDQVTLADIFGGHGWQPISRQVQPPPGAEKARFRIQVNKAAGKFWVDEISASLFSTAVREAGPIDRMYFSNPRIGHFLYPGDPPVFQVTVEATKPLPPEQLRVRCVLRDYWGAEQGETVTVPLTQSPGLNNGRIVYAGTADFSKTALELGKYYEIHGEIARAHDEPYENYSSFVIEPEAVTNSYPANEVPFSSRNWDGRVPATFEIAHRIGIRIMNIWSSWPPTPPYTPQAPCIELCQKYKMGAIFGVPTGMIESHRPGWQQYNETALREGTRHLIQTYRKMVEPFIICLGNEPPGNPDWLAASVNAYRIVYEEAKKTDPSVLVLGTSIGTSEEYFKAGFGAYCDAYDFHCYESPADIAKVFPAYQKLFGKYGHPEPVWSTEIGLNSEGVARDAVAIDMVKKFALFFAGGGACMSWFDFFYPDLNARIAGSSSEAHNTIDARYLQYAPKLTAVTYYNLVNSIAIKKFVEQKQYGDDIHAILFRDRDNRQLQIVWKDKGRQDSFVPLAGVNDLDVIRLDGSHHHLNPGGKGVTLTLDEEPLLLLYAGAVPLASELAAPAATVAGPPVMVQDAPADVTVHLSGASVDEVNLIAPPFWTVRKNSSGQEVTFTLACPETTAVRQANLIVTLGGKENRRGELYLRPMVTGQLSEQILPVPANDTNPPGVKLILKNNGRKSQAASWEMSLVDQLPLIGGAYTTFAPVTEAHFVAAPSGQTTVAGGEVKEFIVPLAGLDAQTAYRVHATVTDAAQHLLASERYVAGFVAVPKATGEIPLDGTLDAPDWKRAPVEKIDEPRQYFSFQNAAAWKGPQDLSATIRFLWDDARLYAGVAVTDDIFVNRKSDAAIWAGDGLQFLIDPCRAMNESTGKYDYAMAVGTKGPQAWCYLSADAGAPSGEARDITVSYKRKGDGTGAITYVVAFPWSRLAPFEPAPGADLGLTLLLNEDDGQGRKSFMTWFGNASEKQVNSVGDLILSP